MVLTLSVAIIEHYQFVRSLDYTYTLICSTIFLVFTELRFLVPLGLHVFPTFVAYELTILLSLTFTVVIIKVRNYKGLNSFHNSFDQIYSITMRTTYIEKKDASFVKQIRDTGLFRCFLMNESTFHIVFHNYRLMTAYLLLQVNCDKLMHHAENLMHQVHKPEGRKHWTCIKIEAKVHYFVSILEHKVNIQF